MGFDQLKRKSTNMLFPSALLSGDTEVMRTYKKMLERGRIEAYIKLNWKVINQQRKKDQNSVIIGNKVKNNSQINIIALTEKTKAITTQLQQLILFFITTIKYRINILLQSQLTQKNKNLIQHQQKVISKCIGGIKINYYEVNSSNKKDNPQITTYIYLNMVLNNKKQSSKTIRQKYSNQEQSQLVIKHSTTKTEIISIEHYRNSAAKQNKNHKSKLPLLSNQSTYNNLASSYLTEEQSLFRKRQDSISYNMRRKNNGIIPANKKGQFQSLLDDELMSGNGVLMKNGKRNIGKRKTKNIESN